MRLPLILALLAAPAYAQQLMVVDNTRDRIVLVSAVDGSVTNPAFIDLRGGGSPWPGTVIQALDNGAGEIWVTSQTADVVLRWSDDGSTYLGEWATGSDNLSGIHQDFNRVWLCSHGAGNNSNVKEYSLSTGFIASHPFSGSPRGITSHNNELLVSEWINHDIVRIDPATGAVLGLFHDSDGITGISRPAQLSRTTAGTILAAGRGGGVFEYDAVGNQINFVDCTSAGPPYGAHELLNGNILLGTSLGLRLLDRVAGTFTTVIDDIDARYITPLGNYSLGTNYCTANPNSTGHTGLISGAGSLSVAMNDLTIATSRLPLNSFGYFITSLNQASIPNPGGSQGVLCLGSSIGRYTGPGQIKNSGAGGAYLLHLNLNQIPTPVGFAAALVGQTRNFQSWHRDAVGGAPTSNFTNGLSVTFQ
jgi:hypothetical protein